MHIVGHGATVCRVERLSGTVLKAGAVLDAVVNSRVPEGLGLKDLTAVRLFGRSTTHRLLQTLSHLGLVSQTPAARYTVGPVMLQYAMVVGQSAPWLRRAHAVLERLRDESGETVVLSLLVPSMERLVVDQVESEHVVRWVGTVGARSPLYRGASGRAILAALPPAALADYLASLPAEDVTGSVPSPADLHARLQAIRLHGYALSRAELSADGAATAAQISVDGAGVVGAVSIAIPVSRVTDDLLVTHGALVKAAAREIETHIRGAA